MNKTTRCVLLVQVLWIMVATTSTAPGLHAQDTSDAKGTPPAISTNPPPASAPAPPIAPSLTSAMLYFRAKKYKEASTDYNALLAMNPSMTLAYAGLARVLLKQNDLPHALTNANKAIALEPENPFAHIALGEVYFRLGKIKEAESEFIPIVKTGEGFARAYLGEAWVSWVSSYYKQARQMIEIAHRLDSGDPDIADLWLRTRGLIVRLQAAQDDPATKPEADPKKREDLGKILQFFNGDQPQRDSCHPVSKVKSLEVPFVMLLLNPQSYRGVGLKVNLNGISTTLMLDTGAGGIIVGRKIAEKAGVTRITELSIGGIGDRGEATGYLGHVDSIRVGNLEFSDCYVKVIERSGVDDDGLIGADLFQDYLVDLDFSSKRFRLSELPPRPGETAGASQDSQSDPHFEDRYVAPEMKSYTQVYRFGHNLLVPTNINTSPPTLFLIDSGSQVNAISPNAAREATKVESDSDVTIKGLSGSVKKVYLADQATLSFGHLRQKNQGVISFDTTRVSDSLGTEVSGFLGFTTLGMLEVKIDYRDGLVDFIFDQNKWCKGKCF